MLSSCQVTYTGVLSTAFRDQVLSFVELQTCMYEKDQLVNQTPIGISHAEPNQGTFLCPNDLLQGRSSSALSQGPFKERASTSCRFDFIQKIVRAFWKILVRKVFPFLVLSPKWHSESRHMQVGDNILVQESNAIRGDWKRVIVVKTQISQDNEIRRVTIKYSLGSTKIRVQRPVQRLIVLVSVDQRSGGNAL